MPQLLDQHGRPMATATQSARATLHEKVLAKRYLSLVRSGGLKGKYDAAQTTVENTRHWANADALSADAAANPAVREILRNRARYEIANNSYATGIVLTLANDTVGTGPRLQLLTEDAAANRWIEGEFQAWARAIGMAEKMRTMRMARTQDGESFALLRSNPGIIHEVKLDLALIEADRVTSPTLALPDEHDVDGIRLDDYGNPVSYRVLKRHPGGSAWGRPDDAMDVPAESMIHAFRANRPGQHRGVPEIMPALPLFAQLRRFTLAVLSAAESQAEHGGFIETDQSPEETADLSQYDPMDVMEAERAMFAFLPFGWKAKAFETSQPASTYVEYVRAILTEIARCLNIPYNVAAGDSSRHNYASGRLDHQTYFKSIRVDQAFTGERVLDRILSAWLREFVFENPSILGLLLQEGPGRLPPHQWFWDGTEHVDPLKEEKARGERLRNKTSTLANECARDGRDWEAEAEQLAREVAKYRELGLRHPAEAEPAAADQEVDVDELAEAVADRLIGATR